MENILIIGDLHAPFTRDDYLEHCKKTYKKFKCNKVIFIGDLIDNNYTSYHEANPDGLAAGFELEKAKQVLKKWYKVFPKAEVCLGNHDIRVLRKAYSSGVSKTWIRGLSEVLGVEKWVFAKEFTHKAVLYKHDSGSANLLTAVLNTRQSIVVGHRHTSAQVVYHSSRNNTIFGMNVGCGVDTEAYAFDYNQTQAKRPIISCGVVLNNGELPILVVK